MSFASPLVTGWPSFMAVSAGWGKFLAALAVVTLGVHWVSGYDSGIGWLLAVAVVIGAWVFRTGLP